jgi:hypothetical protein
MNARLLPLLSMLAALPLAAQVPDAPGTGLPAPAPAPGPAAAPAGGGAQPANGAPTGQPPGGNSKFLGGDAPSFDPGTEVFSWDGKHWNIANNRAFEARFEKYLNAAEETSEIDRSYQLILRTILDRLAPENSNQQKNIDDAFRLLPRAANYPIDAHLCDALADAVYSVWRAQRAGARLVTANQALEQERKNNEWNMRVSSTSMSGNLGAPSAKNKAAADQYEKDKNLQRDSTTTPYATRLAETLAALKANQAKRELTELESKIEFQALLVQLFLQRRFQHVLIGTRFYRALFVNVGTKLEVGGETKDLFAKSTGLPPTVGTMDSMANEAIRDVREGVEAFRFLLKSNELESATKRLGEAFSIGEYMPEIRTLPRSEKRQALSFAQKSYQLVSALEVKDYTLAQTLVDDLRALAKDFDTSKPVAAIETARTISALHLAKARAAAVSGDKAVLESELKAAAELWPRNPALAEVSGLIFNQGDVQQRALLDFDQLLSQHNYRLIFDDRMRFIAASALYPDRQKQLKDVLTLMQDVETAIIQAGEIAKHGDYAGAWETLEKKFQVFPDDSKLNQLRASLTTEASEFVHTLRTAEQLEKKDQIGSSLAWFLKAQKIYPASEFAQDGVSRLVKKVLPESGDEGPSKPKA